MIVLPAPVRRCCRLKASVASPIHFSFSEPYVNTSSRQLCGTVADGVFGLDFDGQLARPKRRETAKTMLILRRTSERRKLPDRIRIRFIGPQSVHASILETGCRYCIRNSAIFNSPVTIRAGVKPHYSLSSPSRTPSQ